LLAFLISSQFLVSTPLDTLYSLFQHSSIFYFFLEHFLDAGFRYPQQGSQKYSPSVYDHAGWYGPGKQIKDHIEYQVSKFSLDKTFCAVVLVSY
jgi:hypothetical protein